MSLKFAEELCVIRMKNEKYIMFELKKSTEELFLIALEIDAKFEGKLT